MQTETDDVGDEKVLLTRTRSGNGIANISGVYGKHVDYDEVFLMFSLSPVCVICNFNYAHCVVVFVLMLIEQCSFTVILQICRTLSFLCIIIARRL